MSNNKACLIASTTNYFR